MSKTEALRQFALACETLKRLHEEKGNNYGTEADFYANHRQAVEWGLREWLSPALRIGEKLTRLKSAARGEDGVDIREELTDIAVLAIIARMLLWEAQNANIVSMKDSPDRRTTSGVLSDPFCLDCGYRLSRPGGKGACEHLHQQDKPSETEAPQ